MSPRISAPIACACRQHRSRRSRSFAYQPAAVTRAEVEAIRVPHCDQTIYTLMQRRLIEERGRREAPGRPILYGTTWEFLECFGLSSLDDLPRALTPEGAIPGVGERDAVGDGSA